MIDYKKKIVEAIRTLGEKDYDGSDLVHNDELTLMLKYYSLNEVIAKELGNKPDPIKFQTKNGKVKEFKCVDDLIVYIQKEQGIIASKPIKGNKSARRIRRRV